MFQFKDFSLLDDAVKSLKLKENIEMNQTRTFRQKKGFKTSSHSQLLKVFVAQWKEKMQKNENICGEIVCFLTEGKNVEQ